MPKKNQPDWSQFTLSIFIASSPNEVYSAWTKPKELCKWFLARAEMDLRQGGSYSWWWQTGTPDTGKILYVRKLSRFSFSFDQGSICEIFIQKKAKGSLLTLRQHHIPVTEQAKYRVHLGCKAGWTFYLTNLKAYLEHEIDLREIRPHLLKNKGLLNQG